MIASMGERAPSSRCAMTDRAILMPRTRGMRAAALSRAATVVAGSVSRYPDGSVERAPPARLSEMSSCMEKVPHSSQPKASALENDSVEQHWMKASSTDTVKMPGDTSRSDPSGRFAPMVWIERRSLRRRDAVPEARRCVRRGPSSSLRQNPWRTSSSRSTACSLARARAMASRCSRAESDRQGRAA